VLPYDQRPERPPRILPTLVVGAVGIFVALTVIGWIIGAVLAALRAALVVVVVVGVIWMLLGRGRR
jgi:hypothetical protein